ncbi:TlpA family protein disulfide reductase [Alicyclobacillus sendaiensis]|uniref:TlpA family protein disulfide reductase n=1 Tax=Alicyclobacillus sendaiensis TaxID=192387 RepID=UPI00078392E5|nr:hypothetical protein [Alicyclobacillus sendaiensis]
MKRIGVGVGIGVVALWVTGCGTAATAQLSTAPTAQRAIGVSSSATPWHGLSVAPMPLIRAIQIATVETGSGELVPLPRQKPIVVFAPWCDHCHQLIRLLAKEGLLPRVTLVAAGLSMYGSTLSVNSAENLVRSSFTQLGISMPADVLYAMPNSALDLAVTRYPTVLIPHEHTWYWQPGYVDNPAFWKVILL